MDISERLLKKRVEQLRADAEARGLQALLIFSYPARQLSGTSTHGYLRYLLDWTAWGSPSLFVLPVHGMPCLVVPIPGDIEAAHEMLPWIADVRNAATADYGKQALQLLREKGIQGRVGVIGLRDLNQAIHTDLLRSSPQWTLEESDALLDLPRMLKDTTSLEGMRQAAATCDVMLAKLQEVLSHPGLPAWQAQVETENAGRLNGADAVFSWFVSGPRPDHPRVRREENARLIQVGDCVVAGLIILQQGFYGHALRTFSIGEPSAEQMQVWQAVSGAQAQAAALFAPGSSISAPNRMAETVMFNKFPEARLGDKIRFRPCHFIGMDYAEYPTAYITSLANPPAASEEDMFVQAGMTMEIHPNLRPPGLGFAAVGDIFVATPQGGECLSRFPQRLVVVQPGK
jgi:Xaa-Pro dipeptidase